MIKYLNDIYGEIIKMSQYIPPHLRVKKNVQAVPTQTVTNSHSKKNTVLPVSDSDFPSLTPTKMNMNHVQSSKNTWNTNTGKRFSDMARSWAIEQKEEEEKQKHLAKEKQTEAKQRKEMEEKEKALYRVGLVNTTRLINGISTNDDVKYNLGGDYDTLSDKDDTFLYEDDDDVEEEVIDPDMDLNYRRNKNDLY